MVSVSSSSIALLLGLLPRWWDESFPKSATVVLTIEQTMLERRGLVQ